MESRKRSRGSRVTYRQMKLLMDYMSAHREFASGRCTGADGVQKMGQQWQNLAVYLNENGPSKNIEQWKKTWRDLKRNVRAKVSRAKSEPKVNDSQPMVEELTEMEEKCLEVIGSEVDPIPSVPEFGIAFQRNIEEPQLGERRVVEEKESHNRGSKSIIAAERQAAAAERQAAAAERQAVAAERRAAAAERKALVAEAEVIAARRRAELAEAASKANTATLQSLLGMCERLCTILEQKK